MPGTAPDLFRHVLEALPVGVCVVDRHGKIVLWNNAANSITGFLPQEIVGQSRESELLALVDDHNNALTGTTVPILQTLHDGRPIVSRVSVHHKRGHLVAIQLRTAIVRNDSGEIAGAAEVFQEFHTTSAKLRRHGKLASNGALDPITGTLTRQMLLVYLDANLTIFKARPIPFCLLGVSLDDSAALHERYGQAAFDAALRMVAETVESSLRAKDWVGRWHDDQLLAILKECTEPEAVAISERLKRLVQHSTVPWWGDSIHISVSLGVTSAQPRDSVGSLTLRAEDAMRQSANLSGKPFAVPGTT